MSRAGQQLKKRRRDPRPAAINSSCDWLLLGTAHGRIFRLIFSIDKTIQPAAGDRRDARGRLLRNNVHHLGRRS